MKNPIINPVINQQIKINTNLNDFFSILPIEALQEIILNLDINELIHLQILNNRLYNVLNEPHILMMLCDKFKYYTAESISSLFIMDQKSTLHLIGYLSTIYHVRWGFRWGNEFNYFYYNEHDQKYLTNCIHYGARVIEDCRQIITDPLDLKKNVEYLVYPNINYGNLEQYATKIIPYKKVVIKYNWPSFMVKPKIWYNSKFKKRTGEGPNDNDLPYLKTRKYIKIIIPYEEIAIDAEIKGKKLTIDDILFACRAFAIDPYKTLLLDGSYKIIECTPDLLIMQTTVQFDSEDSN
jgi:hypothetical protein